MTAPQIFISYRRDDAAGFARAIGDGLGRVFGAERVFIDVDDIGAGQAFDAVIDQAVGGARVLLVLIGRRWAGPRSGQPARLHDPDDRVRHEVAHALLRGLHVVPVLLDGAAMPTPADLPDDLRALSGRNAMPLDNARFGADFDRLVSALRPLLDEPEPGTASPGTTAPAVPRAAGRWRGGWPWALSAGALLLGGVAIGLLRMPAPGVVGPGVPGPGAPGQGASAGSTGAAATAAAARPAIDGTWWADVSYDWPNAHYRERFDFSGDGQRLDGSASFLRVARPIEDGRVDADGLQFVTRSTEVMAGSTRETEHRYRGTLQGDELRLTMQTVGGSSPHAPVAVVARRAGAASAPR